MNKTKEIFPDLIAFVQANEGKQVKLYVYNVDTDLVREVRKFKTDSL